VKRRVRWSREALDDITAQATAIAGDNPAAARRVAARLRAAGTDLGRFASGRKGRVEGTYEKVVARLPYIVAYAITSHPAGGELVIIVRVIHGARDWRPGEWPR